MGWAINIPYFISSNPRKEQLQSALQKHIRTLPLNDCLGVSLTLKQFVDGARLDVIRASQNLRHFMNRLNASVYGNAFKRFGRRLNIIPAIEKSSDGRHYHLILQNPYPEDPQRTKALIEEQWSKTRFGHSQTHLHWPLDHGWSDYITKLRSTGDGIDWECYHWN